MVLEKVITMLAEAKDLDPATITAESNLADLGFDSLDTVELVMNLEDEFGVSIEVNENLKTVGGVAQYIEEKLA